MRALDGKILPARVDEAGARTNLNCMEEQLRIGAMGVSKNGLCHRCTCLYRDLSSAAERDFNGPPDRHRPKQRRAFVTRTSSFHE